MRRVRLSDVREAVGRLPRPSAWHLGWFLLLTWVFCVFYFRSVGAPRGEAVGEVASAAQTEAPLALALAYAGAPLAMSVLALVGIVMFERRIRSLVDHRALLLACPVLATLGTVCILLPAGGVAGTVLFWLGSLLMGVGSGPLWIMWGELYSRLEQGTAEATATVAAVLSMACALVCTSLAGWVADAVVSLLPLASGAMLLGAHRAAAGALPSPGDGAGVQSWSSERRAQLAGAHERARQDPLGALRAFGREGLGILVASAVICHAGSFLPASAGLGAYQLAVLFAATLGMVIAAVGILTPRRFNLQFLYRWMCPFVLACLASLVWFPRPAGGTVAFVGSIGARLAFCLLTQVYFARIAGEGRFTPLQAFGLGWICLHLGDLAGVTFNVCVTHFAPSFAGSGSCALALGLALVIVVMFALNGERTFAGAPAVVGSPVGGGCLERGDAADMERGSAVGADAPGSLAGVEGRAAELARDRGLTARELEVLTLLAQGRSNPYIRDALGISLDTAGTHVKHVYAKLGVHSRQELIDLVRGDIA